VATLAGASEAAQSVRRWTELTDSALWEYVVRADNTVEVGLTAPGVVARMENGRILLTQAQWAEARNQILAIPGVRMVSEDRLLPIMRVKVASSAALMVLRRSFFAAYVEPGYIVDVTRTQFWQEPGCAGNTYTGSAPTISPGDILPPTFSWMAIDRAWSRSTGAGVWVGIVDTGVDNDQTQFTTRFASGYSSGRSIRTPYTSGGTWDDQCGHGTRVAGVAVAPRDGQNIVGVAYGANLHSVRVDMYISTHSTSIGCGSGSDKRRGQVQLFL
jgi:serine protease